MNDAPPVADVINHDDSISPDEFEPSWQDVAQQQLAVVRTWVRQNPLPALGIALASGFVVGRMMRR